MSEERATLDLRAEIARIDRDRAEAQKLNSEARKIDEERRLYLDRQLVEMRKFDAEARRQDREHWQGWQLVVSGMTAGGALVAATAALMKLLS